MTATPDVEIIEIDGIPILLEDKKNISFVENHEESSSKPPPIVAISSTQLKPLGGAGEMSGYGKLNPVAKELMERSDYF
jgi:hypothetical protein